MEAFQEPNMHLNFIQSEILVLVNSAQREMFGNIIFMTFCHILTFRMIFLCFRSFLFQLFYVP